MDANNTDIIGQGNLDLAVLPAGTLAGYIGYNFWGLRWSEKLMTFGIIILILLVLYGIYAGIRLFIRKTRRGGRKGRIPTPPSPPSHYR